MAKMKAAMAAVLVMEKEWHKQPGRQFRRVDIHPEKQLQAHQHPHR